jgi:hypothetical protein
MSAAVYATYALYVDWNNDGDYADVGETVTCDTISATIMRGFANPLARVAQTASAEFVLNNIDRDYSPALVAAVLPRRPVRFTMTYDATTVTLFEGYIESVDVGHSANQPIKTATLRCVDAMDLLNRFEGDIGILTNATADEIIDDVVAAAYTPAATDYDAGVNRFPYAADRWAGTLTATGLIQEARASDKILDACTSDWGHFFIAKDGSPTFRNRHQLPFDVTTVLTLDETMTDVYYTLGTPLVLNRVAVTCYPRRLGTVAEVVGRMDNREKPVIDVGESVTLNIRFRDPANNAINLGALSISTIETTVTDDEAGEGTEYTPGILYTAYGDRIEVTLSNLEAHVVYVQDVRVLGLAVRSFEAVTVVETDATSITAYGRRSLPIGAALMSSPLAAEALAAWLVDYYKDPLADIGVSFSANAYASLLEGARDLELLDRVVVTDDQTGMSATALHAYGIAHHIEAGAANQHRVTLRLLQAYDYGADAARWDEGHWDGPEVWVY